MSWGFVAVAGATVVSGAMASRSSRKTGKASAYADDQALAFEQERYDDWKSTYGGVEDNLSQYFTSLTPDYYEAQGLEAFQLEHDKELENVRTTLAQRGISDSGLMAQAELGFAQEAAQERASIRAEAPARVREEQFRFLQAGLGLNPGDSYGQTLADQANNASADARSASEASGRATSAAIQATGTALGAYLNRPAATPAATPSVASSLTHTATPGA